MDGFTYLLPDVFPDSGIFILDTSEMFSALQGDAAERRGLGMMCHLLKIPTEYLHNAGNDAHVRSSVTPRRSSLTLVSSIRSKPCKPWLPAI